MTIAVDFDGTIVEHKYPKIGKEIPFAIDTLLALAAEGHKLILWTSRDGELLDEALEFCRERGLEFYAINSNYPPGRFSRRKRGAPAKWWQTSISTTGTWAACPTGAPFTKS